MHKGIKADYIRAIKDKLADEWKEHDSLPTSDVKTSTIIDAMAFIQRYQNMDRNKFAELSDRYYTFDLMDVS